MHTKLKGAVAVLEGKINWKFQLEGLGVWFMCSLQQFGCRCLETPCLACHPPRLGDVLNVPVVPTVVLVGMVFCDWLGC